MKHNIIWTEKLLSALSSNNLDKYEYLSDEDLNLKPSTIDQIKFEYSPLGKVLIESCVKMIKKKDFLRG